jgi:activated CDC42 kinase 1
MPKSLFKLIQKCWQLTPSDRPSFQLLKSSIQQTSISEMKARQPYKQDTTVKTKLDIEINDSIVIIDSHPDKFWWKGQNSRTCQVGYFPRTVVVAVAESGIIKTNNISSPLPNSFIHTGHMSSQPGVKQWGNPGTIDE